MTEVRLQGGSSGPQSAAVPSFLVHRDSWMRIFFSNLGDLVFFFRRQPPLELESAPAAFWPDVFVPRRLPKLHVLESFGFHILAVAELVVFSRFSWPQPVPQPRPTFEHAQVIFYQPLEYLPPLDTRRQDPAPSQPADPELSRQPIISLPPEADNRLQTIVAPPAVKLKRDVALPNIVAWSEQNSAQRPQLAIPAPPVVLASERTRLTPEVASPVVAPPPDAQHVVYRRELPVLQTSAIAPPPDLRAAAQNLIPEVQPAIIAPPPDLRNSSVRTLGDMNIGHSAVIAPAPRLPVGEQRAIPGAAGAALAGFATQVVPPPPGLATSGYSSGGARMIALNLRPAVGAPPDPPSGNRSGAFAATPDGHRGASGNPGASGNASNHGGSGAGTSDSKSDLPAGLYVGKVTNTPASPVAGSPAGKNPMTANAVNPRLLASLSPPRASIPARQPQPDGAAKLSEPERAVFGDRKFYSLTLNMPNLNSAGGSWVIRFAELKGDLNTDSAGLAAPTAVRKVDPAYPLQLMKENVAGTVIVYAVIHFDGSVGEVRILRGIDDRIDPLATEAISQWQFQPATRDGVPVDVEATFQIPFRPGRVRSDF
jgi:TonB family protein